VTTGVDDTHRKLERARLRLGAHVHEQLESLRE
jgi:hypothetical protein